MRAALDLIRNVDGRVDKVRVRAVRRADKVVVVTRQRFAVQTGVHRLHESRRVVRHDDFGVEQCGLRHPVRLHAHTERQPCIGRGDLERLCQRFRVAGGEQHRRNADALQYADSGANVRAVVQTALIIPHIQLCDDRAAAQIAQREHSGAQRRKGRRLTQIIERGILVQLRTERLLALLDVVHGDGPVAVLRIRFGRAIQRQTHRQR